MAEPTSGFRKGEAERAILEFLGGADYRPMPQRELLHRMHIHRDDRAAIRRLLRRLIQDGRVQKIGGGRLVVTRSGDRVQGVLRRHREGYGRLVPDGGGEDVFIPPRHLDGAGTGDRVKVRISARGRDGRLHGVVTQVLGRRNREILGVFVSSGSSGTVQPFDSGDADPLHVPASFRHGAEHLHAVTVERTRTGSRERPQGKVLQNLGHLDDPGTDVLIVTRKYGLTSEFTAETLAQAAALPTRIGKSHAGGRERFDDPAPVTIDGETAQDFDDAVAVEELSDGGFRLYVHIADVAHFVAEDSALDLEARRRGTSVYFPGTVLPMFPEKLSNNLCSLRPGVERLVQSAVVDFSSKGGVRKVRFADGVIRSAARLTYTQVAEILDGAKRVKGVPAAVTPMLFVAERLRTVLAKRRHARGSIDFDLPEPEILLDVEGVMTGITVAPRNRAHLLIEEFMLAANEAVAGHLSEKDYPCLYRVHDRPDPSKLEILASFVEGFGLDLGETDETIEPRQIQALIEGVEGRPEARVVAQVALRSMKQARYSTVNSGHFGLAAPTYCHFTSPIRRYPDLVVHRQLRAQRRRDGNDATMDFEGIASSSSESESNAESAERELLVWKKVAYIADKQGEDFDGVVTGVARFGLFVQLVENLVEGLVRVEELGQEYFDFVESRMELSGTRTGRSYRLGDRVRVKIARVDRVLRRVDMLLIEQAKPRRKRGPRGQRSAPKRKKSRKRR